MILKFGAIHLALAVLCSYIPQCKSGEVLFVPAMVSASHKIAMVVWAEALAYRGHKVYWWAPAAKLDKYQPTNAAHVDHFAIDVDDPFLMDNLRYENHTILPEVWWNNDWSVPFIETFVSYMLTTFVEKLIIQQKESLNLVLSRKYDLIIMDEIFNPVGYLVAQLNGAPVATYISTCRQTRMSATFNGVHVPYSYTPSLGSMSVLSDRMNFFERVQNVMSWLIGHFGDHILFKLMTSKMRKHYPELKPLQQALIRPVFQFICLPQPLELVGPSAHNLIYIGGIQLPDKVPPLSAEYVSMITSAKKGAIVLAMGHWAKWSHAPRVVKKAFVEVLSRLDDYVVIWQYNGDPIDNLPGHVKLMRWIPQRSLLAHPSIKLFITHAECNSLTEAVYHAVPMVAVPLSADQPDGAAKVIEYGFGVHLHKRNITTESLYEAITTVLNDDRYRQSVKRVSDLIKADKMSPVERAVHWTEYAMRRSNLTHYHSSPSATDVSFLRYYCFDVGAFLLIALSASTFVLLKTILILWGVVVADKKLKSQNARIFVENCPEVPRARSITSMKGTFDILAMLWRGLKPKSEMLDYFLYFADFVCGNRKAVVSFRQVFEDDSARMFKRIFIVGDAGCGKSTFVNKMALDWACGSEEDGKYLQLKFDLVVYVYLQTLSMNVEHYIEHYLPEAFKSEDTDKILVILDGFDELTEQSEFYDSALRVIKGKALPLFTVIATISRHFHLKNLGHVAHHSCLRFRSFDENEMTLFLNERHIAFPPTQKNLNLGLLLQNTLFCSIYYSMLGDDHRGIIEIEDSYDFVKALVDNWVADNTKTNAILDGENHLQKIGQVAFQLLDSRTVCLIRKCQKICSDDISNDFLTMQTTEARTYFKEPSLFHQLIAEYLAARYFARSLAQNAVRMEHVTMFESNSISSPVKESFFYFLLLELFSNHLEKKVDPSFIAHFFAIAEIRIMWSCKWPMAEIPLDNVETLRFFNFNCEFINHKRFFPTLSKCSTLSKLSVVGCQISIEASSELAKLIDQGYFQTLKLLDLSDNANIGRSSDLFKVLFKCRLLETLRLDKCSMTNSSMEIFLQTFSSENFQCLTILSLCFNVDYDVDSSFIFALSNCPKINLIMLWEVRGCKLSADCREIRKLIESRGCFIDV